MANENETQSTNEETAAVENNTEAKKKNKEAIEDRTKAIKEFLDFQEKSNKLSSEQIELEMDYLRAVGDTNLARQKYTELLKQLEQEQGAFTAQGHEYIELLNQEGELTEEQNKRKEELQKNLGKEAKLIDENVALTKKLTKAKEELGEISDKDQKRTEALAKTFESMTLGLLKIDDGLKHPIRGLGALAVRLANADDGAQVFTEALGKVFNVGNIAARTFETVKEATIKMVKEFDNAAAQFSKTTGLAREYSSVLEQTQRSGSKFSVSAAEGGQAMAGLLANFSDFHKTAPSVQKDLTLNVAQLSKFGVSADESAKLMQNFNKIMGMSGKEAIETSKKIGMMGTKIGISTSKMLKDYTASLKTLAVYGDKSIKVFTGIAAAAKSAGVETGTLLGMVEKFDTFAGAAEGAGKLNAILGSQMSATEMLMMTEDERLKTMISTMQATGQSFGAMDKFTQKAIAQAAGISDMAEANKIFGMSLSEYESYEMQMNQSAKTQERFEEALKSMQPFMEKLSVLANQFAGAFLPVLEALIVPLEFLIDSFAYLNEKTDGYFGSVVGGLAGLTLFINGMGGLAKVLGITSKLSMKNLILKGKDIMMSGLKHVKQMFGIGLTKTEIVQEEIKQNQQKKGIVQQRVANATASSGVGPMLALGAAIAMIGGGIYLAATGMAEFVKSFGSLNSEQLAAAQYALLGFAVGIVALGVALGVLVYTGVGYAAIPILLSIGAAVLMIGLGVGIAAAGFGYMLESIGSVSVEQYMAFGTSMAMFGAGLLLSAAAVYVFTSAFVVLLAAISSTANPVTMAGVAVFAAIAASMFLIGLGAKLANDGLANLVTTISNTEGVADILKSLYGSADMAANAEAERRIKVVRELVDEISGADIKPELENLALITTGASAGLMTENTVAQMLTVTSLADQIKNIFNADITVNIDGDAVKDLFEDGVYKTTMGNT